MKPIWYPLFTGLIVALALYVAYRNWPWWHEDQFEKWMGLFLGALITFGAWGASMGLACGIASIIADHAEQDYGVCWKAAMVSLRSSDGVSGSMSGGIFMMSGHVGSEQFYHYYTSNKDGAFQPHKWKANSRTRVYEEDRKDGEIVQWDKHFKHEWVLWFADPDDDIAMDFHIPKGSLKQQFSLE